jgi:hypothetical protein
MQPIILKHLRNNNELLLTIKNERGIILEYVNSESFQNVIAANNYRLSNEYIECVSKGEPHLFVVNGMLKFDMSSQKVGYDDEEFDIKKVKKEEPKDVWCFDDVVEIEDDCQKTEELLQAPLFEPPTTRSTVRTSREKTEATTTDCLFKLNSREFDEENKIKNERDNMNAMYKHQPREGELFFIFIFII